MPCSMRAIIVRPARRAVCTSPQLATKAGFSRRPRVWAVISMPSSALIGTSAGATMKTPQFCAGRACQIGARWSMKWASPARKSSLTSSVPTLHPGLDLADVADRRLALAPEGRHGPRIAEQGLGEEALGRTPCRPLHGRQGAPEQRRVGRPEVAMLQPAVPVEALVCERLTGQPR